MVNVRRTHQGFTIVELSIVVVIIGILAAIAMVAFGSLSKRARDTQRTTDLANIQRVLELHAVDYNGSMLGNGSGCGANGDGSGWWHSTESTYVKSTRTCLGEAGYTNVSKLLDPSGCAGGGTSDPSGTCSGKPRYMIAHCLKDSQPAVYLLAMLESKPQSSTFTDTLCDGGVVAGFPAGITNWDVGYGINYLVRVR